MEKDAIDTIMFYILVAMFALVVVCVTILGCEIVHKIAESNSYVFTLHKNDWECSKTLKVYNGSYWSDMCIQYQRNGY